MRRKDGVRTSTIVAFFSPALVAAAPARAQPQPPPGPAPYPSGPFGIGRVATVEDIVAWDIDVMADGTGLPPGSGSVAHGAAIFAEQCAHCHGDQGQGGLPETSEVLVGAEPWYQLGNPRPVRARTIGNFWPYATTVFDYVRRAMPFDQPGSLTAWLLQMNGIVGEEFVADAQTLPAVVMPARDRFVPDPRPGRP